MKLINPLFFFILFLFLLSCKKQLKDLSVYQGVSNTKRDTLAVYNVLPLVNGKGYVLYVNDSLNYSFAVFDRSASSVNKYVLPRFLALPFGSKRRINLKIALITEKKVTPNQSALVSPPLQPVEADVVRSFDLDPLPAGSGVTNLFIFQSAAGSIDFRLIPPGATITANPAEHKFKLRVINFSYQNSATYGPHRPADIQVQHSDSSVISAWQRIPFASTSDYQEFDYGNHQFRVLSTATSTYLNGGVNIYQVIRLDTKKGTPLESPLPDSTAKTYLDSIPNFSFLPRKIYSLLVLGTKYTLIDESKPDLSAPIERMARIQFINAAVGSPQLRLEVKASTSSFSQDLLFGKVANPVIVGAGELTFSVFDVGNRLVYSRNFNATTLSNTCFYIIEDQSGTLSSLQENAFADPVLRPGVLPSMKVVDLEAKVNFLNLIPGIGKVSFTTVDGFGFKVAVNSARSGVSDFDFKTNPQVGRVLYDTYFNAGDKPTPLVDQSPPSVGAYFSFSRPDVLAGKFITEVSNPCSKPGSYTLTLVGKLEASGDESKPRILVIKHTNYSNE